MAWKEGSNSMNPDVAAASDVPNIKIKIPGDDESHDQTPPHAAASDLFKYAFLDDWDKMRPIVEKDPNCVRIQLTGLGDTALHVAANAGSTRFVNELVKFMRPEDVLIPNKEGMLPVHLAALSLYPIIVRLLCSDDMLDKMDYEDIEKLFFMTIINDVFDVAIKLFEKRPRELTSARDGQQLTSLHMLARKPSKVLNRKLQSDIETGEPVGTGMRLLRSIWKKVTNQENEVINFELITQLFSDVIESGNDDFVKWCFGESSGILMNLKDSNGRNLLHLAFLYRRIKSITADFKNFNFIRYLLIAVDNEGNNVLHLAALLDPEFKSFSGLSAKFQMDKELSWFKDAERRVPPGLKSMKNKKGKTPVDVFFDEHNKLCDEIKKPAKGIANSGMVVATLVATVAFTAALTVPGGKGKSDWFVVYIIANAIALFSSSASILSFLSNFTSSRFAESELVISLHPKLTFGHALVIISVAAMIVAFIATSFLIFEDTSKWISSLVTSMGVFPLLLFPLFQFSLFDDLIWSRWYRLKREFMFAFHPTWYINLGMVNVLYDIFVKPLLKFVRRKSSDSTDDDF